ncbi:GNAT family N-acetyltransferase [Microbacterium karelineae]|uniref:GNAT family N-acetyltransferase n=1 Tax=Microbacterium karelineae TaxID=2654283 RepID=UPI0012E9FDEC|nr:GNAT family N-acetyltransferase [Microbacterium karelineae]
MTRIRPCRPADRDALSEVCVRTADAGSDARGLADDRLWGDVWAVPYAERDPGLCWVAESSDGRVVGYLVATDDTEGFAAWFRDAWWPARSARYEVSEPTARHSWILSYAAARGPGREPHAATHPAHLHIDLLPEAQGQGLGRRLIGTLCAELRRRRVPAVHLVASAANHGAVAFYERLGFARLPSDGADTAPFGLVLA